VTFIGLGLVSEIGYLFVVITGWIGLGALIDRPYIYQYPTSIAGCNITSPAELANLTGPVYDPNTWQPHAHYRYIYMFETSIQ